MFSGGECRAACCCCSSGCTILFLPDRQRSKLARKSKCQVNIAIHNTTAAMVIIMLLSTTKTNDKKIVLAVITATGLIQKTDTVINFVFRCCSFLFHCMTKTLLHISNFSNDSSIVCLLTCQSYVQRTTLVQQLLYGGLPHRLVTFRVSCDFRPSPLTSLLDFQNWERIKSWQKYCH